jgi:hypothetical protein
VINVRFYSPKRQLEVDVGPDGIVDASDQRFGGMTLEQVRLWIIAEDGGLEAQAAAIREKHEARLKLIQPSLESELEALLTILGDI